jgi:chromosome segregation ATPase
MDAKLCRVCRSSLPFFRRSDQRYCGVRCRVRAHRIRVSAGASTSAGDTGSMEAVVAALATAATAMILERLRSELREERAQRRTQDKEIATIQEKLRVGEKEQARLTAGWQSALTESRRLNAAKDAKAVTIAKLRRQFAARRSQAKRPPARVMRQQGQIDRLRDVNREQAKQLRESKRNLRSAERRITKLLAPSKAEVKMKVEIKRLTKLLDAAQAHETKLGSKVKRLKKRNARLVGEMTLEEEQSWFDRLLGDGGAGQRGYRRFSPRSRATRAELPNAKPRSKLAAQPQRKGLPPKSEK